LDEEVFSTDKSGSKIFCDPEEYSIKSKDHRQANSKVGSINFFHNNGFKK
jgi:hypothetical protein